MASTISKIKLQNYKRFKSFEFEPNKRINILVGDNEAGKSTILEAIDLVISANVRKVENIGIDRIINATSIEEFQNGTKTFSDLPIVMIELFLEGDFGTKTRTKKMIMQKLQDSINKKLRWINCRVSVVDSDTYDPRIFQIVS